MHLGKEAMLNRKWIAYLGAVVALALAAGIAFRTESPASPVALGADSQTALCVLSADPVFP